MIGHDVREVACGRSDCVWAVAATLGESPLWLPGEDALYFLDIEAPAIHRLGASGEHASWTMPAKVGAIGQRLSGGLIAAFEDGVFAVDLSTGVRSLLADPESEIPGNRLNDGRCDAAGRFWFGSMDGDEKRPSGALYRLGGDHGVCSMDTGYVVANGPAFSPDGTILYESDTVRRIIYAFDVDTNGKLADKREFARFGDGEGRPDGLTVDEEGGVWAGGWQGWALTRFAPDGARTMKVRLPTANVTASAFGGRNLDCLYITTARKGLSSAELVAQPLAGGLFAVDVGVRGMPPHSFHG